MTERGVELNAEARTVLAGLGGGDVSLSFETMPFEEGRTLEVARVVLRNEGRHNALSGRMMVALGEAVEALEGWSGAVVVLQGGGGSFCAGADLSLVAGELGGERGGRLMNAWMSEVTRRLRGLSAVSVALVEGVAYGGGAELMTACDHRLISRGARCRFVQAKMGVSPGWGGAGRLREIVGRSGAIRLLTSAERISPEGALQMGLADALFDPEFAEAAIRGWLEPLSHLAVDAIRGNKGAVAAWDRLEEEARAEESAQFLALWSGPARAEAMS